MIPLLLVGANEEQTGQIQQALHSLDFPLQITTAHTSSQCLALLAQQDFALLILDDPLRDRRGLELLAQIRRAGHTMPAILLISPDLGEPDEATHDPSRDHVILKQGAFQQALTWTACQVLRSLHGETPTSAQRGSPVWHALSRAALETHHQRDQRQVYRTIGQALREIGFYSSLWLLDKGQEALRLYCTTYPPSGQQVVLTELNLDPHQITAPLEQVSLFREQIAQGKTCFVANGLEVIRQFLGVRDPILSCRIARALDLTGAVLVPILQAGAVAGVLVIHGDVRADDVPMLEVFGHQLSAALEQLRLREQEHQRAEEMAVLYETSIRLASTRDLETVLEIITETALRLVGGQDCHIYLYDAATDTLTFGTALWRDGRREPAVTAPRKDGLTATVARSGQPLIIEDAPNHPLFQAPDVRAWGIQSVAGFPLRRQKRVLGVFTIAFLRPHRFTPSERYILSLLADQAAVAVENARLVAETRARNEELAILNALATAMSRSLDLHQVLRAALDQAMTALDADGGLIYLLEEGQLAPVVHRGLPPPLAETAISSEPSDDPIREAIQKGRIIVVDDLIHTPRQPPLDLVEAGFRSAVTVPLLTRDRGVGVMMLLSRQRSAFSRRGQALLSAMAGQISVAVENARLFYETQQRNWELSILNTVATTTSRSLAMQPLLEETLYQILSAMNLQAGAFHLLDPKEGGLIMACQQGLPPAMVRMIAERPETTPIGEVLASRKALLFPNRRADLSPGEEEESLYNLAVIPLSAKGRILGTLLILDQAPQSFTQRDLNLLVTIGQQVGVAVENIRLYEQALARERRLRALHDTALGLSSTLQVPRLLRQVLEAAVADLHAEGGVLWLLGRDAQEIHPDLVTGLPAERFAPERLEKTRKVAEWVIQHRQPLLADDVRRAPCWEGNPPPEERGAVLAVLLQGKAGIIGVLEARSRSRTFTHEDQSFLSILANIAAVALENAHLYEAVKQYAISLEERVAERTAELQRQKERIEAILHSVADGVVVTDRAGNLVRANPAAERLLSSARAEGTDLVAFIRDLALGFRPPTAQSTVVIAGRTYQAQAAPVRGETEGDLGAVVVLRDVTYFKELDQLKSEFVSNVSHELRTPLANLKLYLTLLEKGRPERRATHLRVLNQEVRRLETLIEDILDLSRLETRGEQAERIPLQMDEIVQQVVQSLAPQATSRNVNLSFEPSPVPPVKANRDQIIQLVTNLVANAINYTEAGGKIVLTLGVMVREGKRWVALAVKDTGVGIAPSELPHIFDRFYRGERQRHMAPGTGLGLAIVKEILDLHQGWIDVKSHPGMGSTFTVGLPALDETSRSPPAPKDQP